MSEPAPQQALSTKPERNPDGTLKKGFSLNPAGRQALPEWFRDLGPVSLAMLAAAATGVVVTEALPDEKSRAAANDLALTCPPALRIQAADKIADRCFGKPKESVEVSGELSRVTRVILEVERMPEAKVVEGVTAKRITAHDAE